MTLVTLLNVVEMDGMGQAAYTGGLGWDSFDGLPASGDFTLPTGRGPYAFSDIPVQAPGVEGWTAYADGTGEQLFFRVGTGSSTSSGVWSYGMDGDTDRALGSLAAGSHAASLAFIVENQTGETLTRFVVSVCGEQWRFGNGTPNTLTFEYQIGAVDIAAAGIGVSALDFTAPITGGSTGALDGNDPANRVRLDAEVTGISWAPGQSLMLRWQDVNDTGSDDGLALDDFLFHAPRAVEAAPTVVSRLPEPGATLVGVDQPIELVFDQPVTVGMGAFTVTGSSSGTVPFTLTGGPLRFLLTPNSGFQTGETVSVVVEAASVQGVSVAMAADETWTFDTFPSPGELVPIHLIQGDGTQSPMEGADVTVEAVVVGDFQGVFPALGGFFLQEEDGDADGRGETSEGLFVYDASSGASQEVTVGDVVRVRGTVGEFSGMTQISGVTSVQVVASGVTLPTAASLTLPVTDVGVFEHCEGMRSVWLQELMVTDNGHGFSFTDGYLRYGELILSSAAPLEAPTESIDPNDDPASGTTSAGASNVASVLARQSLNERNQITLDDGSGAHYPDPTPYLSAAGTRRCGDSVTGLEGVLAESSGSYRIQPTSGVSFVDANPRPVTAPPVTGRLKVASMNVLNYFTTLGDRGADTLEEFERQQGKIVAALMGLDADMIGLIEMENRRSSVTDLLNALNAEIGSDVYSAVADPVEGVGDDAIRLAWFYKPSAVMPWGAARTDTDDLWNLPRALRPPLAQVFQELATGERFIACVNHFKSKSSSGATGVNQDQGDGQASFNDLRRQQASRLTTWLNGLRVELGEDDVLVVGDLNAYGEEDPIDLLRAGGWVDESDRFSPGDHSYRLGALRGRLDHAFSTATMSSQIFGAAHWHINADEPALMDYNGEGKSPTQEALTEGTPFRSSDHDPVLVGISLSPQPTTFAMWVASQVWPAGADQGVSGDPDGDGLDNLAEFVMNLNPLVADAGKGTGAGREGEVFILDFRRRTTATGVSVIPKWSDDLVDWFPMSVPVEQSEIDSVTKWYRSAQAIEGRDQMFGRLEIDLAP